MKNLITILFTIVLCASCQQKIDNEKVITENVLATGQIQAIPHAINAGSEYNIEGSINTSISDLSKMQLLLHHNLYSKAYPLKVTDRKFNIQIPGTDNELAGEVICRLIYQDQVLDTERFFITSLEAIDKIQNYNGPKNLFANDDDGSMNVSIPHDQYHNPLLPPSKVNYQSSYNGQLIKSEQKEINHLVAYQINPSKKREGKYLIGSSINAGFSQEQELIIGPVMPHNFSIEMVSHHPYADARQYMHFKTSVLKDRWDNIAADGTLIHFTILEEGDMIGTYQAITISGIANVYIENPSRATEWEIIAGFHDDLYSNAIKVEFSKNVNDFPLKWNGEVNRLLIGPVVGSLGQLVPNGTEVNISMNVGEKEDFAFLEDGMVNYKLGFDWLQVKPKELKVLIGGHLKTINIE